MSIQLIQQYHAKVERIFRYGGSRNESALRKPFQDLLERQVFTDYTEPVMDLLRRVTTVSVETMKIIRQMPG